MPTQDAVELFSAKYAYIEWTLVSWYADGRVSDLYVRQHSFEEFGHENISAAIFSLPLSQEGQLSVTGERMCT